MIVLALLATGCSAHRAGPPADTGSITFAAADPDGSVARLVGQWNAAHPAEQVQLHRLPSDPASQHADLLQNLAKPDSGYDLAAVPTTDTAEFASQGWLQPLTGRYAIDTSTLLAPAVNAASYRGKLSAAPWDIDAGLLYYRSDLVSAPPTSWRKLAASCPTARRLQIGCYGGEFAKGPDLTANIVEAVSSSGGQLVRPDGSAGDLAAPGVRNGLQLLADSYRDGTIPKASITYRSSQASQAFGSGSLLFMRNWASSYHTIASSSVKARFRLALLPAAAGPGRSAIAGHNLGLRTGSKHQGTSLGFIRFLESAASQRSRLEADGMGPVAAASYRDTGLRARFPQLALLRQSLDSSAAAISPDYPSISEAISDSGYAAIAGSEPVPSAIGRLRQAIAAATG